MRTTALKSSIWLTNIILFLLVANTMTLISLHFYYANTLEPFKVGGMFNIEMFEYPVPIWGYAKIGLITLSHLVAVYVVWIIRKMLFSIKVIGPFTSQVVSSLRKVLIGAVVVIGLRILAVFVIDLFNGRLEFSLSYTTILIVFLISIIFLLIEVFKYGIAIQEDQKLTI